MLLVSTASMIGSSTFNGKLVRCLYTLSMLRKGKKRTLRASPKRYMMSEVMIKACASFAANNLSEIPLSLYQQDIFHKQHGLC